MPDHDPRRRAGGLLARVFHLGGDEPPAADAPPNPDAPPSADVHAPAPADAPGADEGREETAPEENAVNQEPLGPLGSSESPNWDNLETQDFVLPATLPTGSVHVADDADDAVDAAPDEEAIEHSTEAEMQADVEVESEDAGPLAPAVVACPACGTEAASTSRYCGDCGYLFAQGVPAASTNFQPQALSAAAGETSMPTRLNDRYELAELVGERQGVRRHKARDLRTGQPVTVVSSPLAALPVAEALPVDEDEILPDFDANIPMATAVAVGTGAWPGVEWEKGLLGRAAHASLPKVLDAFADANAEYLVLSRPVGRSLWDAWDDPDVEAQGRYGWLEQIAAGLHALHQAGAMLEHLHPDMVVVDEANQAVLVDLVDALPLPVPPDAQLKASLYTAPELILTPQAATARANLYSFGAMIYSLEYLHHSLEEKDFERQFTPKQVTDRFPDVHPLFLRLINKTFVRDLNTRFPTEEGTKSDPSGFRELMRTLQICQQTFDNVRLDIAAWTTTGMVRTGNEDALAVLHSIDASLDTTNDYAMVLLCDGMGGYEAGEVAAALAIAEMRKFLLEQPMFGALVGKPAGEVDVKACQQVLVAALRHANKEVFTASRQPGKGRRGMGCTAECVYVDARNVIVGHVGDSRTYHLHRGRLVQLTRDQTLVNRLVELGQLSADEAENHPRKNELQQAVGGQPDVMPGFYAGKLQRGDWVLVCSDGLTNHITSQEIEKMLTRETAGSAEEAARRLLNLTNLRGATDNASIVVIRAT